MIDSRKTAKCKFNGLKLYYKGMKSFDMANQITKITNCVNKVKTHLVCISTVVNAYCTSRSNLK